MVAKRMQLVRYDEGDISQEMQMHSNRQCSHIGMSLTMNTICCGNGIENGNSADGSAKRMQP